MTWLHADPDQPSQLIARQHCRHCQPDQDVADIACTVCGDGPILTGELAATVTEADDQPEPLRRWLTDAGWQTTPSLQCPDHRRERLTG